MSKQTVIVLDFGGQYKELIARRVRELGVYSVVLPGETPVARLKSLSPIGLILTGGPDDVFAAGASQADPALFTLGVPVLGICYGYQLMAQSLGGKVEAGGAGEYGQCEMEITGDSPLLSGMGPKTTVLMSHTNLVTALPQGFAGLAHTAHTPFAVAADPQRHLYGLQFHPEVEHTQDGVQYIRNFLYSICGAKGDYVLDDIIDSQIEAIRAQVGDRRVLLALSGGVDSSVCAVLLSRAIPGQLDCVFVDHGFMRKNEGDEIEAYFSKQPLRFIRVNAQDRFLALVDGVRDPELKRKRIGAEFIAVFEEEARKLGRVDYLAQGTIYPDVIESGNQKAATIKSHHNVGGLPERMDFTGIVEPLRDLFKDEVRSIGRKLGLPPHMVGRQPFPGPGLAVRVIGEITRDKLDTLREADAIFREELEQGGVKADQYFALMTDTLSVGVMGDARTYEYAICLRAVHTNDFMTADYVPIPQELLGKIAGRIVGEVQRANRVVYDITGKPPGTIEWE